MKLYYHYKNKPYKYIGLARHSETLEEMVIYETRYDNKNGKVWVRPKGMFFESVKINGKKIPRFKRIPLKLKQTSKVGKAEIKILSHLIKEILGEWDPKWFHSTFDSVKQPFLIVAYVDGKPVGFKLGYEKEKKEFYSWLGGVLPECRGIGIAEDLMKAQHQWCKKQGYKKITTQTQNRFKNMLLLNLKEGFEITGTKQSSTGFSILLEKKI